MRLFGHSRDGGQGLVEFALVLPIVVLITLGLVDAGRGVLFYTELSNASRAGARVAMINQSNDATCAGAETFKCTAASVATGTGLSASGIPDVTIGGADCSLPSNCTATVTVDYSFKLITPIIGALIPPINMSASTTMPLERTFTSP